MSRVLGLPGLLLCLLLVSFGAQGQNQPTQRDGWTPRGPTAPARLTALARSPSDLNLLFALAPTDFGLLHRSADGGRTWTSVDVFRSSALTGLRAYANHWTVTGLGGIYGFGLIASPHDPDDLILCAANFGRFGERLPVLRTLDGGLSWEELVIERPAFGAGYRCVEYDPLDPEVLYTTQFVDDPSGTSLYVSPDGGKSWERRAGSGLWRVARSDAGTALLLPTIDSLLVSTDSGATYGERQFPERHWGIELANDGSDVLWGHFGRSRSSSRLYRSTDLGESWALLPGSLSDVITRESANPGRFDSRATEDNIVVGGLGEIFFHANGSEGWTRVELEGHFGSALLTQDAALFGGNLLTPVRVELDGRQAPIPLEIGLNVRHLARARTTEGESLLAVADIPAAGAVSLFRRPPSEARWQDIGFPNGLSPDPSQVLFLHTAADLSALYMGVSRPDGSVALHTSRDTGTSWSQRTALSENSSFAVAPHSPTTLYATDGRNAILRSRDDGGSFEVMEDMGRRVLAIAAVPLRHESRLFALLAASEEGHQAVAWSDDEGASWERRRVSRVPSHLHDDFTQLRVSPDQQNHVFVGLANRWAWSDDLGKTWRRVTLPAPLLAIDRERPARWWMGGGQARGVFYTDDSGLTSTQAFLTGRATALLQGERELLVAYFDGGIWGRGSAFDGVCQAEATSACLRGRFRARVSWVDPSGNGTGVVRPITEDTTSFWFFEPENLEVIAKVLDGCRTNGHFWVFAAGLTDVATEVEVVDTATGARVVYSSDQGQPFPPIQDTTAFPCNDSSGH